MKKNLNYLMCLAVAGLAFVSCEKDDDKGGGNGLVVGGTITATVANGASYNAEIDSVYAGLEWETLTSWEYDIIAKAPYKNGGFTITLPETVDAKYLYGNLDKQPQEITVSDKTVKAVTIYDFDAIKDGEVVGYFAKSNINPEDIEESIDAMLSGIYEVSYMYADKPTTIKGSYKNNKYFEEGIEATINLNVSLQKGWNVIVEKTKVNIDMAKQEITGATVDINNSEPADLKWYYSSNTYSYYYGYEKSAKSSALKLPVRKHKLF